MSASSELRGAPQNCCDVTKDAERAGRLGEEVGGGSSEDAGAGTDGGGGGRFGGASGGASCGSCDGGVGSGRLDNNCDWVHDSSGGGGVIRIIHLHVCQVGIRGV